MNEILPKGVTTQLLTKLGLDNDNFKMSGKTIDCVEKINIHGFYMNFHVTAGPMLSQGETLKNTFVLEITYTDNTSTLGVLPYFDYVEKLHELALGVIKTEGWILNNHISSWPKFQAIVSRKLDTSIIDGIKQDVGDLVH